MSLSSDGQQNGDFDSLESSNGPAPKPKLTIKGVEVTLEVDYSFDLRGDGTVRMHEIALAYHCPVLSIEVRLYGSSREEAMQNCAVEIYHLVKNHQSRCHACQESILYQLIGDENDPEEGEAKPE